MRTSVTARREEDAESGRLRADTGEIKVVLENSPREVIELEMLYCAPKIPLIVRGARHPDRTQLDQ
jgi:hypothetical protein